MKFIKPTAIVAVLLFILSCNQPADKNSEIQELARATPQVPIADEKENISYKDEIVSANDKSDNKAIAGNSGGDDAGFKQEGNPQPKKEDHRQKQEPKTTPVPNHDWDKKIIKTASVNLEVKDYNTYYASLREKIKNLGGYVAQEEQSQSDYKIENTMIIKVPVDQFDEAITLLAANVQKINERKISSQDVTMEVVDTKSRMEAKKQVRQRYMDLMNQAKNMEEILSVQSSINGVQEQIESASGRLEYLNHSSVFSTINLTYYQVLNAAAKSPGDAPAPSFGKKVKEAFSAGWDIVSNLFVVFVTIWPLLLGTFFAVILYKRFRKPATAKANKLPEA